MEHTKSKWEAKPMLGSSNWGVVTGEGTVLALGLTEATARLIAAAPETKSQRNDLLAACEAINKLAKRALSKNEINRGKVFVAIIHVTEAAIEKAKEIK